MESISRILLNPSEREMHFLIKFEDVNSPEETVAISSKEVYARQEDLIPEEERMFEVEGLEFADYEGFTIVDSTVGRVGEIKEIIEYPQQEMAVVAYQERDILISFES